MSDTPRFRMAMTLPAASGLVSDSIALAQRLESLGYDDIWLADAGGLDALTLTPMLLEKTQRMRIGIAVVPVYTRTPAVLASTFSVIGQAYPGRFAPGLGTSSHTIIENWHGLSFEKPLTRIRETVALLRTMLAGEKTNFIGKTLKSKGYVQMPSDPPVPIYLAALRPNMIETAAEIADGVILNLFPREALPKIMQHIRIGAERAGKDPASVEVLSRHNIAVTDDKAKGREAFRRAYTAYYATPVYNQFLAWAGFEDVAAEIREGWAAKDRERTAAALSDEMVDKIALIGSREEVQELMRGYAAGGIHTNIVATPLAEPQVIEDTIMAFAPENFSF